MKNGTRNRPREKEGGNKKGRSQGKRQSAFSPYFHNNTFCFLFPNINLRILSLILKLYISVLDYLATWVQYNVGTLYL